MSEILRDPRLNDSNTSENTPGPPCILNTVLFSRCRFGGLKLVGVIEYSMTRKFIWTRHSPITIYGDTVGHISSYILPPCSLARYPCLIQVTCHGWAEYWKKTCSVGPVFIVIPCQSSLGGDYFGDVW